jgi:hypothetical protein
MRIFREGNWNNNQKCIICNTAKKGKVILAGIVGTEKGHNMEAKQVHVDCIELMYDEGYSLLYQRLK